MKQDLNGVRTAQDLERKYDFSSLSSLSTIKQQLEESKGEIKNVSKEIKDFIILTTDNIDNLQNQIDGNITTWFFNGIPTLENKPTSDWEEKDYPVHLGDLYYDQDTGYAYRFAYEDNQYTWSKIVDADVTEALAVANSAQDTADSKRRVFLDTPIPPYDNGDMWVRDGELLICQISKSEEETFEENDFISNLKYTDDTLATKVNDDLKVVRGSVTELRTSSDEFKVSITEEIKEMNNSIDTMQGTITQMNFSFQTDGLKIGKLGNDTSATLDNAGLKIYNLSTLIAIFNKNGSGIKKLIVTESIQFQNLLMKKRTIDTKFHGSKEVVSIFWNNQLIETLSDLEV